MLKQLREQLAALEKRASDKLAEMTNDISADQARSIDEEHKAIIAEVDAKRAEIASAEEAARTSPPENDAARAADILDIGTRAGMDVADIQAAIRSGEGVEAFRGRAFDALAARSSAVPTTPGRVIRDERETRAAGLADAMTYRMGGNVPEGDAAARARPFMENLSLVSMAAAAIGHRGMLETVRQREDVLSRAFHTTSDFPAIFGSTINTVLERRYALATNTYRRISARHPFMDFRPHYAVSIGEFPMLEKLTESGEIKFGTFGEGKEQIAVAPYAKGIRLSRQMMVNDRLGAIGELLGGYGRTVARFEEITFYAMMLSANTKLADGQVVFHASRANLAATGSGISVASVSAGREAMRKQKGIDNASLNLAPAILLVSPSKETEAQQFLAPITPAVQANANPIAPSLTAIVAGELSGNAWYLFADPQDAPIYKWGLLDGYEAPRIRIDEPFGTQGMAMTVEHDFGVGAIDYRGGYKNPGE